MANYGRYLFGIGACCVVFCASGAADTSPAATATSSLQALLKELQAADAQERYNAFEELDGLIHSSVEELMKIAFEEKDTYTERDSSTLAIRLLGLWQYADAAEQLVPRVETYRQERWRDGVGPLQGYPCAGALLDIGEGSILEIIHYLRHTGKDEVSDKAIELYARIIKAIVARRDRTGKEAVAFVRRELGASERKENLQRLVERMDSLDKPKPQSTGTSRRRKGVRNRRRNGGGDTVSGEEKRKRCQEPFIDMESTHHPQGRPKKQRIGS